MNTLVPGGGSPSASPSAASHGDVAAADLDAGCSAAERAPDAVEADAATFGAVRVGDTVGRYRIEAVLGEGGAATVFRGRHVDLGTKHALKVLHVGVAHLGERLILEGRIQATLAHPNVVAVTDVVRHGPFPVLVMEHVHGMSLDHLLAQYRPTAPEIDALARDILDGMEAAHDRGLVHRDLKPANVLVQLGDRAVTAKVSDFGLAKVLDAPVDGRSQPTRAGVMMGTPAFMAPEQLRCARDVDHRADVFALGALLYQLVSGVQAFEGDDPYAIHKVSSTGGFRPLDSVIAGVHGLPARWIRAVHAALRPSPADRPQSVAELRDLWAGGSPPMRPAWDLPLLQSLAASEAPRVPTTAGTRARRDAARRARPRYSGRIAVLAVAVGALTAAVSTAVGAVVIGAVALGHPPVRRPAIATPVLAPISPPPTPTTAAAPASAGSAPAQPTADLTAPPPTPSVATAATARPARAELPGPADDPTVIEVLYVGSPNEPGRTTLEVLGVERAWLETPSGAVVQPGDVAPGAYALHVFFDAGRPTRVMALDLAAGERRTVRCDPVSRICR